MNSLIKKNLIHIVAIVLFMLVSIFRFFPQLENKTVTQSDVTSAVAMQKEAQDYNATHDDITYWTNNMFGGMPTYAIWAPTFNGLEFFMTILKGGFGPPIGFFFMAMICFYFLSMVMGIEFWISILAAISFALCSNHMILWEAGHTNKVFTIANASLVVAAIYIAYDLKKYWASTLLMAFGLALNILSGHIQMTYYLFLSLVFLAVAYFIKAIFDKRVFDFFKESSGLAIGSVVALMICFSSLSIQYTFKKDTMRGEPILKNVSAEQATSSSETSGLDWEYAMQWSNGAMDMLAMIVPRSAGGGSAESVNSNSALGRSLKSRGVNMKNLKLPYYFGSLPFTSGAVYFSVLVLCFFLLACIRLRGPIQWWLISSTILLCILSMGKNAAWFNLPFYKIMPLYNSFRAPNSILTVAFLPILLGALLGIKAIIADKDSTKKAFIISVGILSGICLLVGFVLPEMIDFSGPSDGQLVDSGFDLALLNDDRAAMMRGDALRSLLFLGLGSAFYYLFNRKKVTQFWFGVGVAVLIVLDVVPVGFRYLNSDSWVNQRNNTQIFNPRPVDEQIKAMEPNRGAYRVLDLSINTFNSSITSYHHNTIGGYNAAKLQRFQDIIDRHISQNNMRVLNMLNAKYIISRDQQVQINGQALGNAWFVEDIRKVNTPEEEINALNDINPAMTAVALDSEFGNYIGSFDPVPNPTNQIALTSYSAKELIYKYTADTDQFVVFSEIWYGPNKGWQAYIDDSPVDHIRVNYTLRGMKVPAGNHTVRFVFEPSIVAMGINIGRLGTAIFVLGMLAYFYFSYKGKIE